MCKKLISCLLSLIMLLGFFPKTAFAVESQEFTSAIAETSTYTADDSIRIRATISKDSKILQAKDGSYMAMKELTVDDQDADGKFTIYDAIICVHNQYYSGEQPGYEFSSDSKTATQIWGIKGTVVVAIPSGGKAKDSLSNMSAKLNSTILENGDVLNIGVDSAGKVAKNENNAFFTAGEGTNKTSLSVTSLTAVQNKAVMWHTISGLNTAKYAFNNTFTACIGKLDETGKIQTLENNSTGPDSSNNGAVTTTFTDAGTYVLAAQDTGSPLAAVCLVTVLDNDPEIENIWLAQTTDTESNLLTDFSSSNTEYTIKVPESLSSISVKVSSDISGLVWSAFYSDDGITYKKITANKKFNVSNDLKIDTHPYIQIRISSSNFYDKACLLTYKIAIQRIVELDKLEIENEIPVDGEFDPSSNEYAVYIDNKVSSVAITPIAKQTDDIITINGNEAESSTPYTLSLDSISSKTTVNGIDVLDVPVVVQRNGDNYVDHTYHLKLYQLSLTDTPEIKLQPKGAKYIVGDEPEELLIAAVSQGIIKYQWYKSDVNQNENGEPILDATNSRYTPKTDKDGVFYYYCVATNTESNLSTASDPAEIVVYPKFGPKPELLTQLNKLPGDKLEKFVYFDKQYTEGFYYYTGSNSTPLEYQIQLPIPVDTEDLKVGVDFFQTTTGTTYDRKAIITESSGKTIKFQITPFTDREYGGCEYNARVEITILGNLISITLSDPIFVYVENPPSDFNGINAWEGAGTQEAPWKLKNQEDLEKLRSYVNASPKSNAYDFSGAYFEFANDIVLTKEWTSIGTGDSSTLGVDIQPFSGTLDGKNHMLTYAEGETEPLFKYVREATVKNLNICAPYIASCGLVSDYVVDYGDDGVYGTGIGGSYQPGCPDTIDIINCTIKAGSVIKKTGFIAGWASGANVINIQNCLIEDNVKIGWDNDLNSPGDSAVGGFAGGFNGTVVNSICHANVYSSGIAGGIVAAKNQSMGPCEIINCAFAGTVTANGEVAGGIIGAGYSDATNSLSVTVQNCQVEASVTASQYVGGILGTQNGITQTWDKHYISDNVFYGTLKANGSSAFVGGIIGYLNSLNKLDIIQNNFYLNTCGANAAIGKINYVDTSSASHETASGASYFDSSVSLPAISGVSKNNLNRTDDPLGDDRANLGMGVTADQMLGDFVLTKLQSSDTSLKNWVAGGKYPVHSDAPIVNQLNISGALTTLHNIGDPLNLSGLTFTAIWSDGRTEEISANEIKVEGYDANQHGLQKLTATYGAVKAEFEVTVYRPAGSITIGFALLGDYIHTVSSSNTHTLLGGGLSRWIPSSGPDEFVSYTVDANATVKDVVDRALRENNMTCSNPSGNYIESITWNGNTLAHFSNGSNSGWMYTINGVHSDLGVSEQFLNDGDKIIFHYTDDYTKEDKISPTIPDRSSLLKLIAQAEALNEADYTPESWAILQSVLGEARNTAANEGAPSAEIEAMQNSLTAAIESLQRVQLPGFRQALNDTLAYIAQTVPAPAFGTTSGEWSVLALARGGYDPGAGYFDEYYDRIVETVKASPNAPKLHAQKSTDNSRLILALSAIGRDPRKVGGVNLLAAFTDMDWVEYQGVNGPIFALLALDAGNYDEPGTNTRQALVDRIVSRQLSSGGFPINPGGDVDLDMTGMALQALAPYKAQANVSQAIDRALTYLSSVQNQNGGFGNNSEVNVQAIVALSALGIDAKTDARFVKPGGDPVTALLNYAADGGGFKHIMSQTSANAMATDQAAYALVAYTRFLDGKNRLYDMTDVEPAAAGTVEVKENPVVNGDTATATPNLNDALEIAKKDEKDIIQVTVAEKQTDKVAVILNSITANDIADAKKTLDVVTENGGLSIVHEALKSIAEQAGKIASAEEIVLNVERKKNEDETVKQTVTAALDQLTASLTETKDQIAAKASIIEVTIKVNDQPITTFGGNSLTVDLPVSSDLYAAGKSYKTLVISDGGKTEEITGRCRGRNGKRVVTVRITHLSTFVVVPVLAAAEPVKPDQPRPGGNGEIEVRFTLLGDSIHGETDSPHTLRGGNLDTWVSQTTYTLKEGATVWDLLKKVFSDNGMTCSNPSGNYVESITWKGKTLGEFTNGKNSGWMYTLNGTHPSLGVSEQELHDGDRVVWHYTDDYTKEEGSEKWGGSAAKPELEAGVMQPKVTADKNGVALAKMDADSVKEMIANAKENNWNVLAIQPDVEGTATKIGIILTKETVGMITDKSALGVDLRTRYGNIVVTNAGLKALAGTVKETLELSVEKTERGTVIAEIAVDGRRIDNVTGGVLVSLPLEGDGNVVAIIRDGKEEIIRKSVVDGKRMLLLADGSCELKIVDNRKSFNDTPNHWAKDAVNFVSSHELFNGTGANTFAPDTPMSRAMLATVLFRLEDAAADGSNPFSDVAAGTWYTDAVIWASGNKIVNGTGNGFAPDRDVTRQELVAMLYRYANSIGMDTGNTGSLDKFADRNGVADWAQEAMGWAVANGLVNGRTATTLAPEGTATRGEVAAITQRLVTLMVK